MTRFTPSRHKWAQPVYSRSDSQLTLSHNPGGLVQNSLELVLNRRSKHEDEPDVEPTGDINAVSLYNRIGQRYFECGQINDALHCLIRATEFCGNSRTAPRQILLAKTRLNITRICLSIGEIDIARQQAERVGEDLLPLVRTIDDLRPTSQSAETSFLAEEAVMTLCFSWHALALASSGDEAMEHYDRALEYSKGHLGIDHSCYNSLLAARDAFAHEQATKSAAKADAENLEDGACKWTVQHSGLDHEISGVSGIHGTDHFIDLDSTIVSMHNSEGDGLQDRMKRPCSAPPGARGPSASGPYNAVDARVPQRKTRPGSAATMDTSGCRTSASGKKMQPRGQFYSFLKRQSSVSSLEKDLGMFGDSHLGATQRPTYAMVFKHNEAQRLGKTKPGLQTDLAKLAEKKQRSSTMGLHPGMHPVKHDPFQEFIQEGQAIKNKMSMDNFMSSETYIRESVDVLRHKSLHWRVETKQAMETFEPELPGLRRSSSQPSGGNNGKSSLAKLQKLLQNVEKSHREICLANPDCMRDFINTSQQDDEDNDLVNSFKEVIANAHKDDEKGGAKKFLKEDTARFFRARFAIVRSEGKELEESMNVSAAIFLQKKAMAEQKAREQEAKEQAAADMAARQKGGRLSKKVSTGDKLVPDSPQRGKSFSALPKAATPDGRKSMAPLLPERELSRSKSAGESPDRKSLASPRLPSSPSSPGRKTIAIESPRSGVRRTVAAEGPLKKNKSAVEFADGPESPSRKKKAGFANQDSVKSQGSAKFQ